MSSSSSDGGPPPAAATGRGCLALLVLFVGCTFVPILLVARLGPVPGALGAVVSALVWVVWGPRPVPGLVPGLLAMGVLGTDVVVVGTAMLRLVRDGG